MGKYLHKFESIEDFRENYFDEYERITTAFTTTDGTFTLQEENIHEEGEGFMHAVYVWTCGNITAETESHLIETGDTVYVNGQGREVTSVSNVTNNPKYLVPWVSYTKREYPAKFKATINGTEQEFAYQGMVDYYYNDEK